MMPPAATTRRVDPHNTFLKKGFWTPKNFLLGYFGGLNFLRVLRVLRGKKTKLELLNGITPREIKKLNAQKKRII
jgi:hypothetical protein